MNKPLSLGIKIVAALSFLLALSAAVWSSSMLQANTIGSSASQENKPFDQEQKLQELMKKIAGQENKPAEEVFKNVQVLKGVPSARLLRIMSTGFSRSLGVDCTHCHVVDQWEKDEKPTKQIAREMWKMMNAINNEYLKNIKNLKGPNPIVNCTTCHRGQTKPALNIPESKSK